MTRVVDKMDFDAVAQHEGISVCMATFNGARHLDQQIESILAQIASTDELIIVDDCSTDDTVKVVQKWRDPRIRLIENPRNVGHVRAFEVAISAARERMIVLSDQDDVWPPGRIERLRGVLATGSRVAIGRYQPLGGDGPAMSAERLIPFSGRYAAIGNVIFLFLGRLPHYASCMAFRAELKDTILPFPSSVEIHDHWISLAALLQNRAGGTDEIVTERRFHTNNLTPLTRRSPRLILRTRLRYVGQLVVLLKRLKESGSSQSRV